MAEPSTSPTPLVVVVGGAAGALEALERFLPRISSGSGLAVLLVLHVDAEQRLAQALRSVAGLPVVEVEDGARLETDRIYLAPPERLVAVEGGQVRLQPPGSLAERRSVVDHTLTTAARSLGERMVAVILSGGGSDGALGARAVSVAGGSIFVQDPATAKEARMPESALAMCGADHVLPPEALADEVLAFARHQRDEVPAALSEEAWAQDIERMLPVLSGHLHAATGNEFRHYKTSTFVRRVRRRIHVLRLPSVEAYADRLASSEAEAQQLFRDLLIGVTGFFRDPLAFEALSKEVLARLIAAPPSDRPIRIWCAGCATGQEPFSLAMLVAELLEAHSGTVPRVQIFASDIDGEALAVARRGLYPASIASEVGPERLSRFFLRKGQSYEVVKALRERILFSTHNVIHDPPFSRLDLVVCRNLLIYLGSHLQKKLFSFFHYALAPGGYLFLGSAESVSSHRELFRPIDAKHRIAQRIPTTIRDPSVWAASSGRGGPPPPSTPPGGSGDHTFLLLQRILLDEFAPPGVVVDEDGKIICVSGSVDDYLTLGSGAYQNDLVRLAREGLRIGVRAALGEAVRARRRVTQEGLLLRTEEGTRRVEVIVQPMPQMGEEAGLFMVVFREAGALPAEATEEMGPVPTLVEQLEKELFSTRATLERTVEDLEAVNQDLRSSNEELLSMNEELQSANEELETSKEEVQGANELLARANADLENLLSSTDVATLFLDRDGNVRRATPSVCQIYNLRDADAGRPLSDFTHRAKAMPDIPPLEALQGSAREDEVEMLDGRFFLRRVAPYRAPEGEPGGLVVTFVDITERRAGQRAVAASEARLQNLANAMPQLVWMARADGTVIYYNQKVERFGGISQAPEGNWSWDDAIHPEDRGPTRDAWRRSMETGRGFAIEHRVRMKDGAHRWHLSRAERADDQDGVPLWYGTATDIHDLKVAERALRESEARFKTLADTAPAMLWVSDARQQRTFSSQGWFERTGQTEEEALGIGWLDAVHPEDRGRVGGAFLEAAARGTPIQIDYRLRTEGGAYGWALDSGRPRWGEQGELVGFIGSVVDVDGRKRAKIALTRERSRLEAILRHLPAAVLVAELPEGRVVLANERVDKMWRASLSLPNSVEDYGIYSAVEADGRPSSPEVFPLARAQESGETVQGELVRIVRGDGSVGWLLGNAAPIVEGDERVGAVAAFIDVTEPKKARTALETSEAILAAVLEALPVGVVVADLNGRTIRDNAAFRALRAAGSGLVQEGRDRAALSRALAGEVVIDEPLEIIAGPTTRFVSTSAAPVRNGEGVLIAAVAIEADVTGRVAVERDLRRRERELQAIADNIPDILTRFDASLRHVYVNRAVERILGLPPEAFLGKTNREMGMPEDLCDRWEGELRRVFRSGRPIDFDFQFPNPSGPTGPQFFASRLVPELGPEGEVAFVLGVTRDVTAEKRVEGALRDADRRKDEFLAMLAHELRNPLAPVRTGLELLAQLPEGSPEAARALEVMTRQVRHMVRLVDDLLDISRIAQGRVEFRPARIQLGDVIRHAVEVTRGHFEASRHELVLDLPEGPIELDADEVRLSQILENLLTNAAKYTPEEGRIELRARLDGPMVDIRVIDNGMGLEPEMLEAIFSIFTQVDESRSHSKGGLGIGLSLVKGLVELHGGTIRAESPGRGKGSTFTIRLPVPSRKPSSESVGGPSSEPSSESSSAWMGEPSSGVLPAPLAAEPTRGTLPLRILIVDDNEDAAVALSMTLEIEGHETVLAHDGTTALALAREARPAVVLLDLGLPDMSGHEVVRRLRDDVGLVEAVVVALTGWGSEEDRRRSAEAGFDAHLTKPVALTELRNVLARLVPIPPKPASHLEEDPV